MKTSVIIPVYNTGPFLSPCIESVLRQTHEDKEIILVNDGSTDESGRICDSYADKHECIHVIHKNNGGLSSARNAGIKAATGDVITFLDSDDFWLRDEALDEICNLMEKHKLDIIEFGSQKCDEDAKVFASVDYKGRPSLTDCIAQNNDKEALFTFLLKNGALISSACNKVIRRSLFTKNALYFREGIISEDVDWTARLLEVAQSAGTYNKTVMAYRQRATSITHTHSLQSIKQALSNLSFIEEHLSSRISKLYLSIAFCNLLISASTLTPSEMSHISPELRHFRKYLKLAPTRRVRIISVFLCFMGIKCTLRALMFAKKLQRFK